ncbi:MAG: O-antigen ligase family protein [Firmicutes bacterium]|nr:O-antigen ligase family protein [Alicyclobacillaceae bacterium]MCL6497091.1 O-antigen ligase family protein [Bacillota bacterium]
MAKRKARTKPPAAPPAAKSPRPPAKPTASSSTRREPRRAPARQKDWVPAYAGAVTLATLVLTVWPQGLFFDYSGLIVAGLLFLAGGFLLARLDRRAWWGLAPWAAAALGYVLAMIHPLDLGQAQAGAVMHASLAVMAGLSWLAAAEPSWRERLLAAFGGLMALLAWLIPLDTGHWLHLFSGLLFTNRWASVFQYPDTAGALWGAGWLALAFVGSRRRWVKGLVRLAQGIDGAALLLALSRGADLVMPFGVVLALVVWAGRGRWTGAANALVGGGLVGLLLALLWRGHLPTTSVGPILFLALAAVMVAAWMALEWGWEQVRPSLSPRRLMVGAAGVAAAVVVAAALAVAQRAERPVVAGGPGYAISTDAPVAGRVAIEASGPVRVTLSAESRYDATKVVQTATVDSTGTVAIPPLPAWAQGLSVKVVPVHGSVALDRLAILGPSPRQLLPWYVHVLPASLYTRLLEVNGRQLSIWQRGVFVADGIRMALSRPLLGYGAGGWGAGYRQYQSLPYTSREVHDGWVQWWIDGGALAGLGYAGLLAGVLYAAVQSRRQALSEDHRRALAGLVGVNAVLLGHGIVDWDFSFLWVELVVAALWAAMMRAATPEPAAAQGPRPLGAPTFLAGIASIAVLVAAALMAQAQGYTNAASAAVQHRNGQAALTAVQRAVGADGNWGQAWQLLAEVEAASLQQNPKAGIPVAQVSAAFQQALRTEPTNPDLRVSYGRFLLTQNQPQAAAAQFLKAVELGPMRLSSVNPAIDGLYNVAVDGLAQGQEAVATIGIRDLHQAITRYQASRRAIPAGMLPELTLPDFSGAEEVAAGLDALTHGQLTEARHLWQAVAGGQPQAAAQDWLLIAEWVAGQHAAAVPSPMVAIAQRLLSWHLVGGRS